MDGNEILKRELRQYIYDHKWKSFTKIQAATLKYSLIFDGNLILSAPTASGKTEAAFLPAINSIEDWGYGIKILYISPLKALINDQFKRIKELCDYLSVPVTSWHGDISKSEKDRLLLNPTGILMITPESIESMLCTHPDRATKLFSSIKWIIIDEIHSFFGNNRGIQLQSLMYRIQKYIKKTPRYIGLSATLNRKDFLELKQFFPNKMDTKVLLDSSQNQLIFTVDYLGNLSRENQVPTAIQKIYDLSQTETMLVFPNSRKLVEEISTNLSKKAKEKGNNIPYFSHHSSINKNIRNFVENFAKNNESHKFTVCCTSTLELGIDIGSVDSIVQFTAPDSVATLAQRLGRSGRKNKQSVLHYISTECWDLLQGLAIINLYKNKEIENTNIIEKPYDVLAHQIISLSIENNGLTKKFIYEMLKEHIWRHITKKELDKIVQYLIQEEFLEELENELIIGKSFEKQIRLVDFYTMFFTPVDYKVVFHGHTIGYLSPENLRVLHLESIFYLASKSWRIKMIDYNTLTILVEEAKGIGKVPYFFTNTPNVSNLVRRKMKDIILNKSKYAKKMEYCILDEVRLNSNICNDFCVVDGKERLYTFLGTQALLTVGLIIKMYNLEFDVKYGRNDSSVYSEENGISKLIKKIDIHNISKEKIKEYFYSRPDELYDYLELKFDILLSIDMKIDYVLYNVLRIEEAVLYLKNLFDKYRWL